MKILFLTRKFYPSIGGVERHALEVSKRLAKMGHTVTVVTEAEFLQDKPISNTTNTTNITILKIPITVGERLKKFQIWSWFFKNRKLVEETDIIHCHDVFFWMLPFRILYPAKKIFVTFHGWEGVYPPTLKAKWVRKLSEKLASGNICIGDYIKKWYGTKADFVTYGGVEKNQKSKIKNQKQNSKLKIVYIGRLEKDTGLSVYLKALNELSVISDQLSVIFLGDGSLRKEAEKYGKVLGFVKDPQKYISESRFVFTSGYLSILEAMINKKLVFSVYDNPLKKDYLEMSPMAKYMIIENNPKDLSEKIKYYSENFIEEKKMTEGAFSWAKKQTWDNVVNVYLRLWQK